MDLEGTETRDPWPTARGEMADRVRAFDWAGTPLGAADAWPPVLRDTVALVLSHGFAMTLMWGPRLIQVYNDPCRRLMADKHPRALGAPQPDAWPELRHVVDPAIARVQAGETVVVEDLRVPLRRRGRAEDGWFTASFNPVRDAAGQVAGVLATMVETTGRVLADRGRDRTDAELRDRAAWLEGQTDAFLAAMDGAPLPGSLGVLVRTALAHAGGDVRCALCTVDPDGAGLRHVTGLPESDDLCTEVFRIGQDSFGCGLAVATGRPVITPDVRRDPRWQPGLPVAKRHGFRAAWSFPIETAAKQVVGTLAMYFGEPREPSGRDHALAAVLTRAAAVIISRHRDAEERARAEAALREGAERLRQFGEASQDVLWIRDAATLQWIYLTPAFEQIYGLSRQDALAGDNYRIWQDLIVPDDRAHANASIERVRAGERLTFDYRIKRPVDGTIRWLRNTDFPIPGEDGATRLIGGIGQDMTEVKETERRLETLVEGMPQLVWRAADNGAWTWASPQWTDYTGQSKIDSLGFGWLDTLHPDDVEAAREVWKMADERGGFDIEYRVRGRATGEYRWFQTRASPVRDRAGTILEWLGTSTDINALRELQEQQAVLVAELQHRTRNLMGVVRALADKTARASRGLSDFRARYRDRLEALARVQGLLSRLNEHDRVTFDELIRIELNAVHGNHDRVTISGPADVRLRSSTVQTLAMALHELATNAVKYGALGQPSARLAITWSLGAPGPDGRPWLHVDWRESGVRMRTSGDGSHGSGQGRELIERALPYQLSAETSYVLGPDGVHCTIALAASASNAGSPFEHA